MSENTANKSRLAGHTVGNMTCKSVRAACQTQLSFLFLFLSSNVKYLKTTLALIRMSARQRAGTVERCRVEPRFCTHLSASASESERSASERLQAIDCNLLQYSTQLQLTPVYLRLAFLTF